MLVICFAERSTEAHTALFACFVECSREAHAALFACFVERSREAHVVVFALRSAQERLTLAGVLFGFCWFPPSIGRHVCGFSG
jgi:hypothetical protein